VAELDATSVDGFEAPHELARQVRASIVVLGPLLARCGRARVALPGGDDIGARPVNLHVRGLERMGATFRSEHGYLVAEAPALRGASITLDYPSVTATENLLLASVLARGTTVIDNAAREPEIADLALFLTTMGAQVDGAGSSTIEVQGVDELRGAEHTAVPDRIEVGTWAAAAVATLGDVTIGNARPEHLELLLAKLADAGAQIEVGDDGLRVRQVQRQQAMDLVTQYLGRVPKAKKPVPRDIPKEPPQTSERRITLQEPWPLPAVVVAYHITYDGHPDSYPLHIAGKVLSDGQSSRIYKKLVYEQQLALAAFGGPTLIEDPNLFYAVAIVQPGRTPAEVINGLIAEFDRLKNEPISDRELQRTKNQFARDYILNRESDQDRARVLSHAVVIHHDIKTADGEFDIFQNLAVADVQRVARTYFNASNRTVLTLLPQAQTQAQR